VIAERRAGEFNDHGFGSSSVEAVAAALSHDIGGCGDCDPGETGEPCPVSHFYPVAESALRGLSCVLRPPAAPECEEDVLVASPTPPRGEAAVTGEVVAGALPGCRVLLVGELNPLGADPRLALYHLPRHSSGNRLRCIMGITDLEYYHQLDKANLCDGRWSAKVARERLAALVDARAPGGVVVLLGARVRGAALRFVEGRCGVRFDRDFFSVLDVWSGSQRRVFAFLPHPSGLCRLWNEPGAVTRARRLLAESAPWVAWGTREGVVPPAREEPAVGCGAGVLARPAPAEGVCCSCGYGGSEAGDCPSREDGTHCDHWQDGPDEGEGSLPPAIRP
jgi:hypothetical protein